MKTRGCDNARQILTSHFLLRLTVLKKCGFLSCHFAVGVPRCLVHTEPLREIIVHILSDARDGSSKFDKNVCVAPANIAFDPDAPTELWLFK